MPLFRLVALLSGPLLYLTVIALLSACTAYAIHLSAPGDLNFSLLVSRGAQVLLLVSLIPLARALRLSLREIGLPDSRTIFLSQFGLGFLLGLFILTVHVLMLLALGAIKPNPEVEVSLFAIQSSFIKALWVGVLVATMEELIFRGMLLACLKRFGPVLGAAWISAFYYASLHFLKSDLRPAAHEVQWYTGFALLADGARHVISDTPFDSWLALFCAGLFLAAVRVIVPQGLGFCIGIHAGWIVVIKLGRRLTNPDPHAPLAHLVGPYDQIIGYGAAGWITLLLLVLLSVARLVPTQTVGTPK